MYGRQTFKIQGDDKEKSLDMRSCGNKLSHAMVHDHDGPIGV
ncbi:hypothetical protein V6N11_003126 [Hibiscus sabdariffa]|uniref:Uncharacterized protein n=1 Tax=Hibiscus sabdariffa TaxID=183260 RepID=A0ABR2SCK0_9ROSI